MDQGSHGPPYFFFAEGLGASLDLRILAVGCRVGVQDLELTV